MTHRWQFKDCVYQLNHSGLTGELNVAGPTPGLRNLSPSFGKEMPGWPGPLLAVQSLQALGGRLIHIGSEITSLAHRLRRNMVDVELSATEQCPVLLHIYWKVGTAGQLDLEILASSHKSLKQLEVLTLCRAPCDDVFVPLRQDGTEWTRLRKTGLAVSKWLVAPRDNKTNRLSTNANFPAADEMTACLPYSMPLVLVRPKHRRWSYLEMCHRDDCTRVMARLNDGGMESSFGLFGLDLEKGVILRGRLRAAYVSRENDKELACKLFQSFLDERLPLNS